MAIPNQLSPSECAEQAKHLHPGHIPEALDSALTELQSRKLLHFIKGAWHVIEPSTPLHIGWHIECIAEHLEALSNREILHLIINVPPGFLKSIMASVMWPAWHWQKYPSDRFLGASFIQDLANRDAVRCKDIIKSDWYQARWGHIVKIRKGQDLTEFYANTKTGWRRAINVGGGTGQRAHVRSLDDPHNIHQAESDVVREGVITWLKDTWMQRGADPKTSIDMVIMQRLHENDVSGYLLREVGGYTHVCLPMRYEPNRGFVSGLKLPTIPKDPRTEKGQLLDPERIPEVEVRKLEIILGPYMASGQLQQRPAPEEGGLFKKSWWRVYHLPGKPLPDYELVDQNGTVHVLKCVELPHFFDREVQGWDCSFDDKKVTNDNVAGQHWAKRGAVSYALNYLMARMDFLKTYRQVEQMNGLFIHPGKVLVEKAANGHAIVSSLQAKIPGIVGVPPVGSKEARAQAYTLIVEAGQCVLPHPSLAPWTLSFIENMAVFPNGLHDDDTDSWSLCMHDLYGKMKNLIPILTEFDEHAHLSRKPLTPVQGLKAFRLWFGGVYPTCLIGQTTRKGGIVIYHCLQAENMGMEEFVRMRVMPVINEHYPWMLDWTDIGPPQMMMTSAKDPVEVEREGQIIERLLHTTFAMGRKDFQTRAQVSKEILKRVSGFLMNCERTPGETGHHLLIALQSEYGYEMDMVTGHVKRERPFEAIPGYAVGEALTTGLAHFYAEPLRPVILPKKKEDQQKRATGYAVQ